MKNIIRFECLDENVVKYFPPIPAKKVIPDWYKNQPFYNNGKKFDAEELQHQKGQQNRSVKACVPVADYMTSGYMLRFHTDIAVKPVDQEDGTRSWWWAAAYGECESHPNIQMPVEIGGKKHEYFKPLNMWTVRTAPGYSCYFYQPEFFFNENYKFLPGIVDTDQYPHPVHFPGIITTDKAFTIEAGDPWVVVFPFKRESWEHEVLLAEHKQARGHVVSMFFERAYKRLFHSQKDFK